MHVTLVLVTKVQQIGVNTNVNVIIASRFCIILLVSILISGCITNYSEVQRGNSSLTPTPVLASIIANICNQQAPSTASSNLPHHIVLYQNDSLVAGLDHIMIMAYVTDAFDRPVSDGTELVFLVNQTPWAPEMNGSLSTNDSNQTLKSITMKTQKGWANVSYGGISWAFAGMNASIKAYCLSDPTVNNSTIVNCYYRVSTYVMDINGIGVGGATVTLHAVGFNDTQDVYNQTTTTESQEPNSGFFLRLINSFYIRMSIIYIYRQQYPIKKESRLPVDRITNQSISGGIAVIIWVLLSCISHIPMQFLLLRIRTI